LGQDSTGQDARLTVTLYFVSTQRCTGLLSAHNTKEFAATVARFALSGPRIKAADAGAADGSLEALLCRVVERQDIASGTVNSVVDQLAVAFFQATPLSSEDREVSIGSYLFDKAALLPFLLKMPEDGVYFDDWAVVRDK
jgi:hypothetical protein